MDDWYLNNFFNLFNYFSDNFNRDLHLFDNFLNSILDDDFFNNSFDFLDLLNYSLNCHYLLNNLGNLNHSFNSLDDWDWPFNDSINNLISYFDMIIYLLGSNNFLLGYDFFYNFLDFDNLGNLYNSVNYFFHNHRDLSNNLNHSFCWDDFLNKNFHLLDSSLNMIHNSFDFNNSFNLDWPLFYSFNYLYLRNFPNYLHNPLNDLRNFHNLFHYSFNWNHFFHDVRNNCGNFQRHIDDLLYLSNSFDFNNFLDNFFNWDNLRNFYDSIYDFLNNLFHFHNLRNNSKHLENVVNIDNAHNFLVNHSNDAFIDFENSPCPSS